MERLLRQKTAMNGGGAMENLLWNLFLETGDPMGYLLLRAEERGKERENKPAGESKPKPAPDLPQVSV